ncbi:MAG: hypothetical protein BGO34_06785 [Bacteroidia bacterium 44-10]|nr:MAG: hypothetical protein BGO34_06785 [Bacteroidia bacterium 44-10]
MEATKKAMMLRIYVSNTDKIKHMPLYEALAFGAKRYGLSGATVYKGLMGYGASSELHSDKFWEITEKIPMIIEIIDDADKIDGFLKKIVPWVKELPKGCLITCQETEIILTKQGKRKKFIL